MRRGLISSIISNDLHAHSFGVVESIVRLVQDWPLDGEEMGCIGYRLDDWQANKNGLVAGKPITATSVSISARPGSGGPHFQTIRFTPVGGGARSIRA